MEICILYSLAIARATALISVPLRMLIVLVVLTALLQSTWHTTQAERISRKPTASTNIQNRPPLISVNASSVMSRNQTDKVDLRKVAARRGEIACRYVLSVLDDFSRFVFLEALPDNSGVTVARALEKIYMYSVVGPPRILQSDSGKEFTARVVRKLMATYNCRMIHGSAYHPQSQGKASVSLYVKFLLNCYFLHSSTI